MNRLYAFFAIIIVLIITLTITNVSYGQSVTPPIPATVISTPVPSSQQQRISEQEVQILNERIGNLENYTKNLNNPFNLNWTILTQIIIAIFQPGWIFALVAIIIFEHPIRKILGQILSLIEKTHIKWGDIELTPSGIGQVVKQKEMLRVMISLSMVDNDPSPEELRLIADKSIVMKSSLDYLEETDKKEILIAAIEVALADGIFMDTEYGALKEKASDYHIPFAKLDRMIINQCSKTGVDLPPVMRK